MQRTKLTIMMATTGLFFLSACADPATSGDSRAKQGAITGAIAGGLFGLTRKGDDKAIKGAGGAIIGAAIGGAIGTALDKQAGDLRQSVGNDVQVTNAGDRLIVTMPQDILFATDSATLTGSLQSDLGAVARNLQKYPDTTVEIVGHTDNTGAAAYNQDLSTRRAAAVSRVLINNGVPASRVRSYGQGEDAPIASNLTPEGRAQNRRVEIVIRPNT